MAPTIKATVSAIIASQFVELASRAPMAMDAVWILTIELGVAGNHAGNFTKDLPFVITHSVIVSMRTIV